MVEAPMQARRAAPCRQQTATRRSTLSRRSRTSGRWAARTAAAGCGPSAAVPSPATPPPSAPGCRPSASAPCAARRRRSRAAPPKARARESRHRRVPWGRHAARHPQGRIPAPSWRSAPLSATGSSQTATRSTPPGLPLLRAAPCTPRGPCERPWRARSPRLRPGVQHLPHSQQVSLALRPLACTSSGGCSSSLDCRRPPRCRCSAGSAQVARTGSSRPCSCRRGTATTWVASSAPSATAETQGSFLRVWLKGGTSSREGSARPRSHSWTRR
mmetsp:Transcript_69445/g.201567  ORF Transcript_69445/g.201567 Transcript_69445/m.201567 type:complete len:272 (+) Transcript_69445:149-964(+)